MNKQSTARTCLWFALILLLTGGALSDPAAGFALFALSGVSALGGIVLGNKRLKLIGALALLIAVSLALATWPAASSHQSQYMERVKRKAAQNSPAGPGQ